MTNKEAQNLLSRNKSVFQYDTDMSIAIDLAIDALKYVSGETSFSYDEKWLAAQNRYKSKQPDPDEWKCNGAL